MEPVFCKGNAFWKGDERFLIKGISYIPRKYDLHKDPPGAKSHDALIDPLGDDHFQALKRDIGVFQEIGLNTIQISGLDPTQSHAKAMKLLQDNAQKEKRWQWRDESSIQKDWGNAVSWRIGEGAELRDLITAKEKLQRARL